ncbi:MAG: YfcE family phosphodiesterase [Firmicutes bacterium]|nr:YfcE family phosphodiesterase [Bacillota bacterium]
MATRIIVFTDVHGHTHNLLDLVPCIERADFAFFLGDGMACLEVLPSNLNRKLTVVRGNCDFAPALPKELVVEIGEFKFLLTHGHAYNVKSTRSEIEQRAAELGVDVALFGHTHQYAEWRHGKALIINVPPLGDSRTKQGGSYLEITIDGPNKISHVLCSLD